MVAIADIRDEVRRSGRAYRFHLIARRMRPGREEDALLLGAPGSGEVLWLQGLHLADDRPFCLETRLINPAIAEGAKDQDFTALAPGAWLLDAVPWSVASHRVRAVNATATEAKVLELAVGEACLEIVRRTQVAGEWVTGVGCSIPAASTSWSRISGRMRVGGCAGVRPGVRGCEWRGFPPLPRRGERAVFPFRERSKRRRKPERG